MTSDQIDEIKQLRSELLLQHSNAESLQRDINIDGIANENQKRLSAALDLAVMSLSGILQLLSTGLEPYEL